MTSLRFALLRASPTSVGFGSHCCVLRKAVLAKTSLIAHAIDTGSPRNWFNDKGQRCPLRFWTGSNRLNVFKNPLSRERQRLESMFAVQRLSSPPLPPSSCRPAGSQHPKPLAQGARPSRRLRVCSLQAPPFPLRLPLHKVGDCGRRANGCLGKTGCDVFNE